MARIVITTFGSTGDLNPYLACGLGLKARGHDVCFAVEEVFRAPLEAAGLLVFPLSGDAEGALAPYAREMFAAATPLPSLRVIFGKYVIPLLKRRAVELRAACAGVDLLVSSIPQIASSIVAEQTGIRWASVSLTPIGLPADRRGAETLTAIPAPLRPLVYRASFALANSYLRRVVDRPANAIRAECGLPPRRNIATLGAASPELIVGAFSPAFCPPSPDWPAQVRVTGFPFYDGGATWNEPAALTDFLAAPGPVVAVSSGSMSPSVAGYFDRVYHTSITAARRAGARVLVIGAAPGALPEPLPEGVFALPFAPFSRVYPRCAAVIHHGGIGTTAQGLRAGVPALVLPWGADQFFHGAQIAAIGVGKWLPRRAYTVERGAKAIAVLLHESSYRARAHIIADHIAREDGVAAFCDAVESLIPRPLSIARGDE